MGVVRNVQNLVAQTQPAVVAAGQLDLSAIRQRLENSGFDVGGTNGGNPGPVLMVVNSTDAPATKVQIAQFLNNSTGISWNVIPQDASSQAGPTTLPSGIASGGQVQSTMNVLAPPWKWTTRRRSRRAIPFTLPAG